MATSNPSTRRNGLSLSPAVIVALGAPAQADERLIGLQTVTGRLITFVCDIRLPSLRLPRIARAAQFLRTFF